MGMKVGLVAGALALAALSSRIAAQSVAPSKPQAGPPTLSAAKGPPGDSAVRIQLLNDVFPIGMRPRLMLTKGVVYRIESPAGTVVSIRTVRQPSLPPRRMEPLVGGGPPMADSDVAFLIVPNSTEEYWLDLSANSVGAFRVRVETDPEEMSRLARIRVDTKGAPPAGFGLSAVLLGAFTRPGGAGGPRSETAAAYGVSGCLAAVPRGGGWYVSSSMSGCALEVATFARTGVDKPTWYLGTEPGIVVSQPGATVETSVTLILGIATAMGVSSLDYAVFGLGGRIETPSDRSHLWLQASAGLVGIHAITYGYGGETHLVPRVTVGVVLRP